MKKDCVAILFKVVMLDESTYAFLADRVIEGTYAEGFRLFVDDSKISYHDISKKHVCSDKHRELFGFAAPLEEIKLNFDTDNKEDALKCFLEDIREIIYVGVIDDSIDEFQMLQIFVDDIINDNINLSTSIEEIVKKEYNLELEDSLLKSLIKNELSNLNKVPSFSEQESFECVKQYIIT